MFAGRRLSGETMVLIAIGAVFFTFGAFICVSAYKSGQGRPAAGPVVVARLEPAPALPPPMAGEPEAALPAPYVYTPAAPPKSIFTTPLVEDAPPPPKYAPAPKPEPAAPPRSSVALPEKPTSPSIALGNSSPMPPTRPIELSGKAPAVVAFAPSSGGPGRKTDGVEFGPKPQNLNQYDRFTAVYDILAHTVYMPDGARLEAHSGLGPLRDDPAHVDAKDRGSTPPHIYELTMREEIFHGVQALRLNPVGGPSAIFGRDGLLAHTYMLGPNGDSNGCLSFKNYDAFLSAFQSGQVKKLVVVTSMSVASR
jgi:hypothetical protein